VGGTSRNPARPMPGCRRPEDLAAAVVPGNGTDSRNRVHPFAPRLPAPGSPDEITMALSRSECPRLVHGRNRNGRRHATACIQVSSAAPVPGDGPRHLVRAAALRPRRVLPSIDAPRRPHARRPNPVPCPRRHDRLADGDEQPDRRRGTPVRHRPRALHRKRFRRGVRWGGGGHDRPPS